MLSICLLLVMLLTIGCSNTNEQGNDTEQSTGQYEDTEETTTENTGTDASEGWNKDEWDEKTAGYMELFFSEMEQAKYIVNRPQAYEAEGFHAYYDLFEALYWMVLNPQQPVTDDTIGMVYGLAEARSQLVQTEDPEAGIWYIWGDDMAAAEDADTYDYSGSFDNEGFRPFLVPYLLKDQDTVKGNIIVIAGGGFYLRSNSYEGYAVAEKFNELGYNAFVLQRRVAPSEAIDASLDLQRSIRYLRYHADELGIAKTDDISACGFSGGGETIINMLSYCYGDELPTNTYEAYQADKVDQVNADISNALLIYGAFMDNENQAEDFLANPNLPAIFMCVGQEDIYEADTSSLALYTLAERTVPTELHVFSKAEHGFGADWGFNADTFQKIITENTTIWTQLADTFMQIQAGQIEQFSSYSQE